uniref:Ribosomal protein S8 n=1 Tax=Phaeophyceae sp. TaxID=2249243 RepID=A0A8E8U4Z9_9PHAE|nr:ribosomal protein S8 [Phaeophyceae sp.]
MLSKVINRIRNSYMVYHFSVTFKEVRFTTKVLDLLWKENMIRGYSRGEGGKITVLLRYFEESPACTSLIVLTRPRDRLYISLLDLVRLEDTFGVIILSTTSGILTSQGAIRSGKGGELLAFAA